MSQGFNWVVMHLTPIILSDKDSYHSAMSVDGDSSAIAQREVRLAPPILASCNPSATAAAESINVPELPTRGVWARPQIELDDAIHLGMEEVEMATFWLQSYGDEEDEDVKELEDQIEVGSGGNQVKPPSQPSSSTGETPKKRKEDHVSGLRLV
ncbi:hypothetical protein BDK51DRAFT_26739 [Blyttiomyces helicus]|uniref:Uncharacterized protein n=1 Tax=Blyttiomyces helicus TaxID=388810 RepID=A0A4P9WIE1_9FUNG|nr:hypothetical protein BDK51DRAFT_26739 [Blyttiomyces helicus]|eukprot:RKO90326.1 hypothetical protein BDK51DRAFT_26739 [Blyttiomyces helicus]